MTEKHPLTKLENLPNDILGEIISRVGIHSRTTVRHVMETSTELAKAAVNNRVYKMINLRPLAMNPLAARNKYQDLMERTLSNGNVEAHYIKGIQEYFHNNNITTGQEHLKAAAEGSYNDGIYLYGMVMLCRGHMEEGKTYLDKLGWQQNKAKADRCWRNIKKSLHGVRVSRLPVYMQTIRAIRPTIMCNLNDLENRCHHCYYYKQMVKFVFII